MIVLYVSYERKTIALYVCSCPMTCMSALVIVVCVHVSYTCLANSLYELHFFFYEHLHACFHFSI